MSRYKEGGIASYISTSDLSAITNVGLAVKADVSNFGQIVLATAATDVVIGTLLDHPKAGATGNVRLRSAAGTMSIMAGAAVAIGDAVTANASSKGITTVTAGNQIIGYAMEAGVLNQIIELLPSAGKF